MLDFVKIGFGIGFGMAGAYLLWQLTMLIVTCVLIFAKGLLFKT